MATMNKIMRTEQCKLIPVYCMWVFTLESRTVQGHRVYWAASKANVLYKEKVQRVSPTFSMQESNYEHKLYLIHVGDCWKNVEVLSHIGGKMRVYSHITLVPHGRVNEKFEVKWSLA